MVGWWQLFSYWKWLQCVVLNKVTAERFRTYSVRNARQFSFWYLMVCGTGQKLSHLDSVRSTNTKCMKGFNLNTETIDGKNTMHYMARIVFQVVQDHTPTSKLSSTKPFILTRDHFIYRNKREKITWNLTTCNPPFFRQCIGQLK
jgi:hypothetical protein